MIIPFNDLNIIHKIIKKEVLTLNEKTISKNSFILSDEIRLFEENFAKFSNCKFSISCSNGTDALTLVLNAIKGNEYKNEQTSRKKNIYIVNLSLGIYLFSKVSVVNLSLGIYVCS